MSSKIRYRRRLPHIQPPEGTFSITYRLAGSLPKSIVQKLKDEYEGERLEILCEHKGDKKAARKELTALRNAYFQKMDRYLDQALHGPTWLSDPKVAEIVMESLHHVENEFNYWKIWSYCIMSNHVHLECTLTSSAPPLNLVMKSHKTFTSTQSNRYLGRTGSFWQEESFDRLVRDPVDFYNRVFYTINNSVEAGLVEDWQQWPYTYVHPEIRKIITL
jgi:putative transposase